MKSFCHLPEEIAEEIFLRLPPKSLQCCQRVCKLWFSMINDPKFIDKQLDLSIARNKHPSSTTFFILWDKRGRVLNETFTGQVKHVLSVVTIHDKDESDGDQLPCVIEEINFPSVPETEKEDFPVNLSLSHCNGLFFFHDTFSYTGPVFVLCNPELGEFKLLRTPCFPRSKFIFVGVGFGYDRKANDYKCVKLFSSLTREVVNRAMVYSLASNSWREVKIDLNGRSSCVSPGMYHRGVFYWWNTGRQGSGAMVLTFDFSKEEFRTIPLPKHAEKWSGKIWKLTVWNESVVFFITAENLRHSKSFEMWVMVENFGGVEGFTYWTKHLTIGPLVNIRCPLAFWKEDELLMQTRDVQIVSYNLRTQKSRKLPSPGSEWKGTIDVCLYPKSPVSLKRATTLNCR